MQNKLIILLGVSAFLIPESGALSIFLVFLATALILPKASYPLIAISVATALASLFLVIPAPLATAIIAASALSIARERGLASVVLILQTSLVGSLEAILGGALSQLHIEASAPAILAGIVLIAFNERGLLKNSLILLVSPLLTYIFKDFVPSASWLMIVAALPTLVIAYQSNSFVAGKMFLARVGMFVLLISLSWIYATPRSFSDAYFLLPETIDSPQAKFFENYSSVSNFIGLNLKQTSIPQNIPEHSLLVLPWLTESINVEDDLIKAIKVLANKRRWTVILVGEHTNMNGVAERINSLTGSESLRNDLTTPRDGKDASGVLRSSSIWSWPQSALINRGASVAIHSIFDKVLISGDGWWAENNIDEWLWVGDYVWQPSDRNGRLNLAAAYTDEGAHWVVFGDSTPFLNFAMLADSRSTRTIIELASLWPTFQRDLFLIGFLIVCAFTSASVIAGCLATFVITLLAALMLMQQTKSTWNSVEIGESAFTESNFNNSLAKSKALLDTPWKLIRSDKMIEESLLPKDRDLVIFGLIRDGTKIAGTTFRNCHRIGNIKTSEGPTLMNAQACKIVGEAKAIIGSKDEAAAIKLTRNGKRVIIILDQNFLAQNSKKENVNWLVNKME